VPIPAMRPSKIQRWSMTPLYVEAAPAARWDNLEQ
jgi:hypothetical protein